MKMFLGSICPFRKGPDLVDGQVNIAYNLGDQNEVHLGV